LIRFRLEAAAAAVVSGLLHPMPRRAALAAGAFLGRLWGGLDRRHVAIAVDNLRRAFPEWRDERVLAVARGVYVHFGSVLLDLLWMQGRTAETLGAFVDVEGGEHVDAALASRRGVVYCTAHLGNWEVAGIDHGWRWRPMSVVTRELDNPALEARLCALRVSSGNTILHKRRALGMMIRTLREGNGVAIVLDQNVQVKDGIFVEFFGRPASATTVAAALALKTGCLLVPARAVLGKDRRYRVVYEAPLEVDPTGDRDAALQRITQVIARRIEDWIRETPEQWLWMHRRWKTQPPPGPAATDRRLPETPA
jgi:KDO2-lipid IV(A) lauroyltransferase